MPFETLAAESQQPQAACTTNASVRLSAEIPLARQPWSAVVRIEALAQAFDAPIEVVLLKKLIQAHIEGMRGTARQVLSGHPHRVVLRVSLPSAHRHRG
jgi:hypothetical protein